MISIRPAFVPFLALTFLACNDPTASKPKALVGSASAPVTAATSTAGATPAPPVDLKAPAAPAGAWPLDPAASSLGFVGSKVTGSHDGTFTHFAGWFAPEGGKAEGGKAAFVIDLGSLKTDSELLDKHLRGPDFFEIATYPVATFTATSIQAGGGKAATHTITGDLELHGTKRAVTFPAAITLSADSATATAEFSINRRDFAINYPGKVNDFIKDDVLVKISLKALKPK